MSSLFRYRTVQSISQSRVTRCVIAAAAVGAALALREALSAFLGSEFAYITFYPAVMLAATVGGLGPGLVATALAVLCVIALISPLHAASALSSDVGLALFSIMGVLMSILGGLYYRARRRAAHLQEMALREGNERFRTMIQALPCFTFEGDAAGRCIFASDRWYSYTGLTPEETFGTGYLRVLHPNDVAVGRQVADSLRAGSPFEHKVRLRARDGSYRWFLSRGVPRHDTDGRIVGWAASATDIEDLVQAEEGLRVSKERLTLAMEYAGVGIWDAEFAIGKAFWSPQTFTILGYDPESTPQPTLEMWRNCIHPEDRERVMEEHRQALAQRRDNRVEYRIVRANDGRVLWISALGRHIYNDAGQAVRSVGLFFDITQRKQAEAALQRERAFLRQVLDAAPGPVFVKSWDGKFLLANQALARIYGTTIEEMLGKTPMDILHTTEELALFESDSREVMMGRRTRLIPERKITSANGELRWFSTVKVPLINEDGTCDRVLGVATDITERKRAEQALKRDEAVLKQAGQMAHVGAWEIEISNPADLHANPLRWSDEVFRIFGHEPGEVEVSNRLFYDQVFPEDRPRIAEAIARSIASRQPYSIEHRIIRPDGSERTVLEHAETSYDPQGRPVHIVGAVQDITERKQTEEALRTAAAQLAEANRRKDEFLAMLAHELRNPLAPIRFAVQILNSFCSRTCNADDPMLRQRQIIDRQVSHMARLLDDLLDVSRVTRGNIVLVRHPVLLADVLSQAIETVAPLLEARRHILHIDSPPADLRVEGDTDRLTQVFGNLLGNAAKYTDDGGRIWVQVRCEADQAMVSIRDTGMGIAPEMLPHVFELFAQAEQSLGRSSGGLGIGLTMVEKLVQLHGGKVEAHSEGLGRGSEFVVCLPVLTAAAEFRPEPSSTANEGRRPDLTRRRVLVVDDMADAADSVATLLEVWGYEAKTVHDGASALAATRDFRPEVVLLDIGMPGMDGFEVARRLRAGYGSDMLLVAMTGYGQEEDRHAAEQAGFDRLLVKPVDVAALHALLAESAQSPAATG